LEADNFANTALLFVENLDKPIAFEPEYGAVIRQPNPP